MVSLFRRHRKAEDAESPSQNGQNNGQNDAQTGQNGGNGQNQQIGQSNEVNNESKSQAGPNSDAIVPPSEIPTENPLSPQQNEILPVYEVNVNGHRVTRFIAPDGESGRKGIHPLHFFKIIWSSASDAARAVNLLWPAVPAAVAVRYARPDWHLAIFVLNYIAMVPCANLIGFAGQELARKLPRVFGILIETTLGSVVEIVLFMVLLKHEQYPVIQAAILGSILATLLMCLGMCFFVGGILRAEQEFDEAVGEVGNGLLLTA
jgi:Ca2+:H+ antiporter